MHRANHLHKLSHVNMSPSSFETTFRLLAELVKTLPPESKAAFDNPKAELISLDSRFYRSVAGTKLSANS
jgi:hypothetical protein